MLDRTSGPLSVVLQHSLTYRSRPRPLMCVSHLPLNLPNDSMPIQVARFSGVRHALSNWPVVCWQWVAARRGSERKMLPLDHVTALGSFDLSFSTVVPLPVPERPTSTITPPWNPSPRAAIISSDTSSGVLPSTWICV